MSTGEIIALISVSLVFIFGVAGPLIKAVGVLVAIRIELTSMRIEFRHMSKRVGAIERTLEIMDDGDDGGANE